MTSKHLYFRLLTYVRPYWKAFLLAVACQALSSLAEPAFPALLKYILDDGFARNQGSMDFVFYPALLFVVFLSRAVIGYIADYLMTWVSQNVISELRQSMFARLLALPAQYFTDHASGRIMSRITYDVNGVAGATTNAITSLIRDSMSVLGLMAWLFYLNWKLTLITLVMVPFIALAVRVLSRRIRRFSKGIQETQGAITQILQEAIEGSRVIKIFGGQSYEQGRFNHAIREQRGLQMRSAVSNAALGPITQFFAALALSLIMAIALYQAGHGKATVGDFVSFITAMLMTIAPMKRLTDVTATIQRGVVAASSVFELIDQVPEKDEGKVVIDKCAGDIHFDQVSFSYPGSSQLILDKFDLHIKPGECVALVGPSGSGKTTIANLLPRFYAISQGALSIDGYNIAEVKLESLRKQIAYVGQDVVLFNDTVAANIAYGQNNISHEQIVEAARAAHALEFIERLPEGLETLIGEKGVKLSGGQRQRLAIARALVKNAPVLILDEATSALDTHSERQVQEALEVLMLNRTTLIIAHRLSTVERADRIVVLAHGQKVEEGRHHELLAKNGLYSQLHRMQQAESKENSPEPSQGNRNPC